MSDLSEYDKAIVAAAEKMHDRAKGCVHFALDEANAVVNAVQAKREAQRPRCLVCPQVATWMLKWPQGEAADRYCDFHRPQVTDL